MRCQVCQTENQADANFCVNCGAGLELRCPKCDHPYASTQNFCGNCGFDLRRSRNVADASPATYTPEHLAERILAQRHLMIGERKWVTVLFADVVDSTATIQGMDPEDAVTFLNTSLGAMMDAIHQFEGTVNELRGDGIMALFGAPIAHEDHAIRACRAALDIPAAVTAATHGAARTRVGLHSGEVLVREVGNDLSVEYQALGPTVHLAARMESLAAPGSCFVTEDVRRLIEGVVEYQPVGRREVKGFDLPIDVYELTEPTEATPWQARAARGLTAFGGRRAELERMWATLSEVGPDRGRVVTILGEAGVGKSRLVHEFIESPQLDGFQVLRAEASAFDVNTPYYPIKWALRTFVGADTPDADMADALRSTVTAVDPNLEAIIPALSDVLDLPIEAGEQAASNPTGRRRRIRDAIRALTMAVAQRRPLVIVVEDLHWIDGETQTVLDDLAELAATTPMLIIVTYRPEYADAWTTKPHVRRIHLQSLSGSGVDTMLDHLLGDDPTVVDLKPLIARRSDGIPLFVEEIVRGLVDAGSIVGERGDLRAAVKEHELEIPDSVQAVLAARIDTLDPDQKHVLQVAAVAGATAELQLLTAVMDRPEPELLASIDQLQSREFLRQSSVLPPVYRFGHALIRDVAYASLPMAQRAALHEAMVAAIETAEVGNLDGVVERLAFHAARGGLGRKAVDYCSRAADKSIDRSAFREAMAFIRDALDLLDELPADLDVVEAGIDLRMKMRVAATGATGGLKRSLGDLAAAQQMAIEIDDSARQGLVAVHYGYTANMLGYPAIAEEQSRLAEAIGRERGDRWLEVEGRLLRAQTYAYAGQPDGVAGLIAADFPYLSGELRHETMGQTMIRSVVAAAHLGMAAAAMGEFDSARAYEADGTEIAHEVGRPFDQMYMHFARGVRLSFELDFAASVHAHERSKAIAEEQDIWFMTTFAQPWLGHALTLAGNPADALVVLRRVEASAARVELPYVEALAHAFASEAAAAMGDAALARESADFAIAFNADGQNPLVELIARWALGRMGSADDLDRARTLADAHGHLVWRRMMD